MPDEKIVIWSPGADLSGFDVAVVADPPPGVLPTFPDLGFIQSAWAGVDSLLGDPSLPDIPLARLFDPALAGAMAESVLAHVMVLHCQLNDYAAQQRAHLWRPLEQPRIAMRTVGLLGMGEMGSTCAELLRKVGFQVSGWSRSGRPIAGIRIHSGREGFRAILEQSEILVNTLPLTSETAGILGAQAFERMPRGAGLVNVGRGEHVVMSDLLEALEQGRLGHAVLDVFETEPLPPSDPLWSHAKLTITPHVAAPTDPASASLEIAANIRRYREKQPLAGLVSSANGY